MKLQVLWSFWNEWNWQFFNSDFSFKKKTITRFSLILENFKNACPTPVASYIVSWYLDKTGCGRSRIFVTQAFNKIVSALFWGLCASKTWRLVINMTKVGKFLDHLDKSSSSWTNMAWSLHSGPLPRIWVQTRGGLWHEWELQKVL
jgi:hypothetical protein